jgi:hypothetical protein
MIHDFKFTPETEETVLSLASGIGMFGTSSYLQFNEKNDHIHNSQ